MRHTLIALAFILAIFPSITTGSSGPEIRVDKLSHDFGGVIVGKVVQTQFSVSNAGDSPLVISKVETTCGCTGAVRGKERLEPGEKTTITVSYDSSGLSSGRKSQNVIIHSNDPRQPSLRLQIFANIIHLVSIEPTVLVKRLPKFQEHLSFPATAKNNTKQPVTLAMAGFQGSISKAMLQPEKVVVQPNSESRFSIELFLVKPKDPNFMVGAVSIRTNNPSVRHLALKYMIKIDQKK
jgi:Protein of unknown function (DUF1573)